MWRKSFIWFLICWGASGPWAVSFKEILLLSFLFPDQTHGPEHGLKEELGWNLNKRRWEALLDLLIGDFWAQRRADISGWVQGCWAGNWGLILKSGFLLLDEAAFGSSIPWPLKKVVTHKGRRDCDILPAENLKPLDETGSVIMG